MNRFPMKFILKHIGITALLCISMVQYSEANETITWFVIHRPPGMILDPSGKIIIGGATGKQLLMLQAELTNYTHENVQMNWGRFWNDVKQGKNICNSISFKTPERETIAEFSIPAAIILPLHIAMRKDTYETLGKPESISLIELMNSKTLNGGLIDKRSYTEQIDALLMNNKKTSGISRYVVDIQRLVLMLMHKRFDYTLEYPPAIDSVLASLKPGENVSEIVTVPATEIGPFYYVYIACTGNDWGKQVVRDLNAALKKVRLSSNYRDTMKEAYSGAQLDRVMRIYDKKFIQSGLD